LQTQFQKAVKEYGVKKLAEDVGCEYETARRWTIDTLPDPSGLGPKVSDILGMSFDDIYGRKKAG
jgi:hypothetical protein